MRRRRRLSSFAYKEFKAAEPRRAPSDSMARTEKIELMTMNIEIS